ncbi:hypothetical protein NXV89_07490 [Bacteroides uniformis]|nr:hypothetical protein [Bacteroides uniformis]
MISISMPKGCRYMSDYENLLNGELPLDGKFILNKTVTGCGGTSLVSRFELSCGNNFATTSGVEREAQTISRQFSLPCPIQW